MFDGDIFRPDALRRNRIFLSYDVEYARQQISAILQPHQLMPVGRRGAARCYADHLAVGGLGVGALHFGEAEVLVPAIADYHLLIICKAGRARIELEGREFDLGASKALIVPPGARMHARFSEDCEQFFLRLPAAVLRAHAALEQLEFAPEVDLERVELTPLLTHLRLISSNLATAELLKDNIKIRTEYERMLVDMLLAGQPHGAAPRATAKLAPRSVRLAEAFIQANYDSPLTLEDIAAAGEVPARTLLSSFRRFRSTSPIRYLRDVRLDAARAKLLASPRLSISAVALEAGFTHFGRFAIAYAERFNEKPSETVRARRGSGAA